MEKAIETRGTPRKGVNAAGRKRKEHGEIGQLGGRCNYSGEEEG